MIMQCNDAMGCGTLSPMPNLTGTVVSNPMTEIPYERMTNFTAAAQMPVQQQSNNIPPVPGTTDIPTPTGVAATLPQPTGATFAPELSIGPILDEPLFPGSPNFTVPTNPLLPPGYQEVLDYESVQYLNGFLRTQIGKYVRVEQLIGANTIEDRYGYLVGVGINYILLQNAATRDIVAVDFYNIKFVYFYYDTPGLPTGGNV